MRQRLAIVLIATLFALALGATWFMLAEAADSDFSSPGFVVVFVMLSVIVSVAHLGTAAAVLWQPRLGRYLGTLLGILAVMLAAAQVQALVIVALAAGIALIVVSMLPDGPPLGRTDLLP